MGKKKARCAARSPLPTPGSVLGLGLLWPRVQQPGLHAASRLWDDQPKAGLRRHPEQPQRQTAHSCLQAARTPVCFAQHLCSPEACTPQQTLCGLRVLTCIEQRQSSQPAPGRPVAAGDAALGRPAHHALHSMGRGLCRLLPLTTQLAQAGCGNPAAAYYLEAVAHRPAPSGWPIAAAFASNMAQAFSIHVGRLDTPPTRSAAGFHSARSKP